MTWFCCNLWLILNSKLFKLWKNCEVFKLNQLHSFRRDVSLFCYSVVIFFCLYAITWSTVCSSGVHWQVAEGDMIYLCKQERELPTRLRRRISGTHAFRGKTIPGRQAPMSGMKVRSLAVLSKHSTVHIPEPRFSVVVRWTHDALCA